MENELKDLLVSGKELDQKLVANILSPYIRIDKDNNTIRPFGTWNELKADVKVLIYLLAKKAMVALGLNIDDESASATEIMNATGLKKGTVNPSLRKLFDNRIIEQTKERRYLIPNHSIETIKNMITGDNV
jgi:hypothetical protein